MVLPLGDSPNPRGVPFVTWFLIALNVAIYLLVSVPLSMTAVDPSDPAVREYLRVIAESTGQPVFVRDALARMSAYDLYVFEYGFRPAEPQLWALFYSIFLHGGFAHLFGNMLFLWIYGDNVEHRMGRVPYLFAYLATGVAATLFHAFFDRDSQLPLVGASGAISGVLGFYFLWFPHNQVRLLFFLFPFFTDVVQVRARWLLGFYLIADNLFPFLFTLGNQAGGVAYGAHIGGFLGGLVLAKLFDRREERAGAAHLADEEGVIETGGESLADALRSGRMGEAARVYFGMPPAATRRLLTPEHSLSLGEWLRRNGYGDAALTVFRRHLRYYPHGPLAAEAHLGAGLIQLESDQPAAAYQHLLDALDLDPLPETARSARAALDIIAARQRRRLPHRGP